MCFCTEAKIARQLQLYRGLFPVLPPNLQGASVQDIPEVSGKRIGRLDDLPADVLLCRRSARPRRLAGSGQATGWWWPTMRCGTPRVSSRA
jgi:hypothetical protein